MAKTKAAYATAGSTGRLVDPRAPEDREAAICNSVSDLILDGDVAEAMAAIRRGLKAQTTVRAPRITTDGEGRLQNDYMLVDDTAAQLAAARLLFAYKFGNPSSVVEMRLAPGRPDETKPLTRDEMIAQLRANGTDVNLIVSTWVDAAKKVEETGPLPADLAETRKAVEEMAVIDV